MTQTADVEACPGKCVHSLASLICDEVREEVECPGASMKCCVERGGGMPPLPANERVPSSSANEKTAPVNIITLARYFVSRFWCSFASEFGALLWLGLQTSSNLDLANANQNTTC